MEHLLKDADAEHQFILGGRKIKNLNELASVLKQISDAEFSFYVNENKNDFSNWIKEIIKDEVLAEDLIDCNTREETINCIESRIDWINYEIEHQATMKKMQNILDDNKIKQEPLKKIDLEELKPLESFEKFEKGRITEKIEKTQEKNDKAKYPRSYVKFMVREFLIGMLVGLFLGLVIGRLLSYI